MFCFICIALRLGYRPVRRPFSLTASVASFRRPSWQRRPGLTACRRRPRSCVSTAVLSAATRSKTNSTKAENKRHYDRNITMDDHLGHRLGGHNSQRLTGIDHSCANLGKQAACRR